MMNAREKLYFLLDKIVEIDSVTTSGKSVVIDPLHDLNRKYRPEELVRLFLKLQQDEKVLKVLKIPSRIKNEIDDLVDPYEYADDGCWHIMLTSSFNDYFQKIRHEPEYQKFTGKEPPPLTTRESSLPKYRRKTLEKIWDILQEIDEKRQLGSEGGQVRLIYYPTPQKRNDNGSFETRKTVLEKFQSLGAIVGLHKIVAGGVYFWSFNLGGNYKKILEYYEQQFEKESQLKQEKEIKTKNPVYKISYSEQTREIIINGFLFKKLRSFSENDAVFAYLYKNPNEEKTDNDIKTGTGYKKLKDFNKFVENIGFKGDYRKVFFKVSKNKIKFNNPITKEYLQEIGIERLEIPS